MYISIEGTVGVGKSTLIALLSKRSALARFLFEQEPVRDFEKLGSFSPLAWANQEPRKFAATNHTNILRILDGFFHKHLLDKNVILERCHLSTDVFVAAHLAEQNILPVEALVLLKLGDPGNCWQQ